MSDRPSLQEEARAGLPQPEEQGDPEDMPESRARAAQEEKAEEEENEELIDKGYNKRRT